MAFTGPIEDRLAIRELLDSYADAVLHQDAEAWGANWAEDALWNMTGFEVVGRAEIVKVWKSAMAGFKISAFIQVPGSIVIDGDRATGTSQTIEALVTPEDKLRKLAGAYEDSYVKRDGAWKFARRVYRIVVEG